MSDWQEHADCRRHQMDPDPAYGYKSGPYLNRYAAAYCSECPVIAECAADALEHRDISVVRAGLWLGHQNGAQPKRIRAALRERAGLG